MSKYRTVKTSELRQGDIVCEHGMRLLIDRDILVSKSHAVSEIDGSSCRYTSALVLNPDEVKADGFIPMGWLADWDRTQPKDAPRPHNGQYRWSIQGNDLARWAVEN